MVLVAFCSMQAAKVNLMHEIVLCAHGHTAGLKSFRSTSYLCKKIKTCKKQHTFITIIQARSRSPTIRAIYQGPEAFEELKISQLYTQTVYKFRVCVLIPLQETWSWFKITEVAHNRFDGYVIWAHCKHRNMKKVKVVSFYIVLFCHTNMLLTLM